MLWLEIEMSDQFAGLIQVMAAVFGFCAHKPGAGRSILFTQIRKSLELNLKLYLQNLPDLHFLLLVQTAIFTNFSYILIRSTPCPARSLRMAW